MRIVLSNIGTFGDINPLIAIALELKRRGHTPVMALPEVYRPKIAPLGLEFHALRPDIDPANTKLVEMIYDVKKGTETGLREFLFPVLRQTYDDLLDAATKPVRADLLLLGELNYAGPIVAEVTGIPWASYVLAPFSFFSAFDPPVLPPYPRLARADKSEGHGARDAAAGAVCDAQMAGAGVRAAARAGIAEGQESDLRCQALAEPGAGAVLARAGRGAEGLAGEHADHRVLLLRCGRGQRGVAGEA